MMQIDSTPIKIPRPIHARQFAIPLVEGVDERRAMKDFDQYLGVLGQYGFKRVFSARSIKHSSLNDNYPRNQDDERVEDHELWYHPAGVLARLGSYSTPAYQNHNGDTVPARHALSSLHLEAKIDTGNGGEVQHRSAVEIKGSGGTSPMFDGSDIRSISETVHSNTHTSLRGFLDMIQRHGKLLPFEQWDKDPDRFSILSLPGELIEPVLSWPPGQPFEIKDRAAKLKALFATAPKPLADLFGSQLERDIQRVGPKPPQRTGPVWDPVEFGIKEFSEALFLAGIRWTKPAQSKLLETWHHAALGRYGTTLDPVAMRAFEQGPAGLSLPVALLYAKRSAPEAAGLLDQLLRSAPLDVLRRWATEPDAAGYTLALRALDRSFTDRTLESHAPPDVDVLGILHERLGLEGLVLSTPTRSALGIALQSHPDPDNRDLKSRLVQHAEFAAAIERLEGWGAAWDQDLCWRNYPNLYQDKDKPAFFRAQGSVDPRQWVQMLGPNHTPALDVLVSRLEKAKMSARTLQPATRNQSASPRL